MELPPDYQQPVGLLSTEQLAEPVTEQVFALRSEARQPYQETPFSRYSCDNTQRRYLLSVYGNVFDVSDRCLAEFPCLSRCSDM